MDNCIILIFVCIVQPFLAQFLRYLSASSLHQNVREEVIEMVQATIQLALAVSMAAFFAGILLSL
jgi:ABC-type dipeptide/oligopeptide/nickel transport system permease component